jgi:hypothetical protein
MSDKLPENLFCRNNVALRLCVVLGCFISAGIYYISVALVLEAMLILYSVEYFYIDVWITYLC